MNVLWFKIATILIIFTAGLTGGTIPMRISLSPAGRRWLTRGNAFAGGIFLGAGLIHLLTDSQEIFGSLASDVDYPLAFLLAGMGFLLVLFIERVLIGGEEEDVVATSEVRPAYPFLLILVLSVHSIIAGTALGLEAGLIASFALFIAVLSHKGFAAFALGVSLRESAVPTSRATGVVAFFSFMTPLGVILGTVFAHVLQSQMSLGLEAVFDGLAAGTFLYVGILEIIEEVFAKVEERWPKFGLMAVAFGFMALLAVWT